MLQNWMKTWLIRYRCKWFGQPAFYYVVLSSSVRREGTADLEPQAPASGVPNWAKGAAKFMLYGFSLHGSGSKKLQCCKRPGSYWLWYPGFFLYLVNFQKWFRNEVAGVRPCWCDLALFNAGIRLQEIKIPLNHWFQCLDNIATRPGLVSPVSFF